MCEPHPACTGCASRTRCATISCVPAGIRRTASSSSSSGGGLWHAQTAHIVLLPQTPLVGRHARHTQNSPHTLDGVHCGSLTHRKRTREGGVSQSFSQLACRQAAALTRWRVGTVAGRASFHPVAHGALRRLNMHWGPSNCVALLDRSLRPRHRTGLHHGGASRCRSDVSQASAARGYHGPAGPAGGAERRGRAD